MGTHGRSGFDRFAAGIGRREGSKKARCPVVTVPPPTIATSVLPFKRLLCPVDSRNHPWRHCDLRSRLPRNPTPGSRFCTRSSGRRAKPTWSNASSICPRCVVNSKGRERSAGVADSRGRAPLVPAGDESRVRPPTLHHPEHRNGRTGRPHRHGRARREVRIDLTLFGSTTNQVVRRERARC